MDTEITFFLGRFHPLVVHLPIGFLIFGLVLEMISLSKKNSPIRWAQATEWAFLGGGISGLVAVITGWMLAGEGQHGDAGLDWHRWMGVLVCVLSFLAWALKSEKWRLPVRIYYFNLILLVLALFFTGHLGGNLTHGSDYLIEHAPGPVRTLLGSGGPQNSISIPHNPDSVGWYQHLIRPMLSDKCMTCHNADKAKGGLDLTSEASIMKGGDEMAAVVRGKPWESGMFQRVTLPQNHSKFMPPKGPPLNFNEIKILEWWIESGASMTEKVSGQKVPIGINRILLEDYGLDTRPKPFFEIIPIEEIPQTTIDSLLNLGFKGGVLSEGNNYLRLKSGKKSHSPEEWKKLLDVKDHIVTLDLSGTKANDSDLEWVGQLPNLYTLDLNNTEITDQGLESLVGMERLEILNLYGTPVSDSGLVFLKSIPSLKKVYLWSTDVSGEHIDSWRQENGEIEIVFDK
ncbi:MAG TPA: c-type cytochrome domain-containing protein [Membranihabitans sp.]|nr:c-type cytochrome domain-containing protein [Membranihabitans sp.]